MYIVIIFLLFLLSLPFQIGISVIVLLTSGFPVVFKQKRIGKNGKLFLMYKFRTMEISAEKKQKLLQKQNEADGPVFKIHNDPRFTKFGKFLSHTGLDELPQLWNVLRGDMALIGPRPLPIDEANKLTRWQQERYSIKPGIISPWILEGYHSKPFTAWMRSDIAYIEKKSWWYDTALFLKMMLYVGRLIVREIIH
jgi:lipopolysaccharide/colanic/teichoic acid biosynthesis glycosyltransferase